MEIITGRYAEPVLGFPSYGIINISKQGYRGEKNIFQEIINPVAADNKKYSDLYMLEREKLLDSPFDWLYIINEDWLRNNKGQIFNYSHSNSPEFQKFVDDMTFPFLENYDLNGKERNHLVTAQGIPFDCIDKVIIIRKYPGHTRAVSYMRHFVHHKEEINYFKTNGSYVDLKIPKAIEFILK